MTELDVTAHVRAILTTITAMAAHRAYRGMDRWLHMLGYRGHISTKSRLFSTTIGALRAYRAAWTRQQHAEHAATPTDADRCWGTPARDAIEWEFDRVGLCNLGERALILSAAQRMIEHRQTAARSPARTRSTRSPGPDDMNTDKPTKHDAAHRETSDRGVRSWLVASNTTVPLSPQQGRPREQQTTAVRAS